MEEKTVLKELEQPALRQMVLENRDRIIKNEKIIQNIRMENNTHYWTLNEFDQRMRNFHEEFEESMRKSAERMDRLEKFAETSRIEQEKRKRDLDARFAETDRQLKETDRQLKETSLEVKRLSRQLNGTTGHVVEGLVSSTTEKIFKKAGLELYNSGKRVKRSLPSRQMAMEVDVLLSNEGIVVPIEVKTNCTKDDVKWYLHQMELFRSLFPEHAGREVFAAMAAINYGKGAAELAHKEGLLVIRVSSDDIFSIDPFKREDLHNF